MAGKYAPHCQRHVSTQQSVANYACAQSWFDLGASRVVLARELSLREILGIRERVSPELELETFCHGAMCVSYSGRCLLSNYMTGRDSNRGQCAQPCRYQYALMEEKRPGEYFPVFEDEKGTYIMNSRDMCMIDHLDELCDAGIDCLKIEGRAKSAYYAAIVTGAYRHVLDDVWAGRTPDRIWRDEVEQSRTAIILPAFTTASPASLRRTPAICASGRFAPSLRNATRRETRSSACATNLRQGIPSRSSARICAHFRGRCRRWRIWTAFPLLEPRTAADALPARSSPRGSPPLSGRVGDGI